MEVVEEVYRNLGVHLDNRVDGADLRELRSFKVCSKMLHIFC